MSSYSRRSIQKYKPFELVVDTNIVGDSGVGNFILRPNPSGSYRYYVEWGDGSVSASTTSTNLTHSYSLPGIYNVNVYGRFDGIFNNNSNEADKILDVLNWGNIKWRFFSDSFYGCANLTGLTATPPIFNVVNSSFSTVFNGASNFNQDIGSWDVGNVTSMIQMFVSATNFNQDIGSWDVSNVQSMSSMFFQATNFNNGGSPSISGWTTSACTNMNVMFLAASNFNQPIGSWDVSNVQLMGGMFQAATNFNQDIGSWDVSNVQTMGNMFFQATNFNQPIGSWDVSNVQFMTQMFFQATNFNQPIGSWDVGSVISIGGMFNSATNFNQPIGSWDVGNVNNMFQMFNSATNFNQDIGSWNVSGVTNMSSMLNNTAIDVTNYNNILTGWTGWDGTGATRSLQSNVTFGASGRQYSLGSAAEDARNYLITGLTWTITDAGGV